MTEAMSVSDGRGLLPERVLDDRSPVVAAGSWEEKGMLSVGGFDQVFAISLTIEELAK